MRSILRSTTFQTFIMMVIVFGCMSLFLGERFLRYNNIESITFLFPEIGFFAVAIMISMLTGGIDLSIIAVANLVGVSVGLFFIRMTGHIDSTPLLISLALVIAAVVGLFAGMINGFIITKLKVTPILATLGSGMLFTGISMVLTGGPAIVGFPDAWLVIGNETFLGLSIPFILFMVVATLVYVIIQYTPFGINLKLIGTNSKAALYSGINNNKAMFYSYVMTAQLAAVAGILMSSRMAAAKSDYGTSYLLQAVLIAVLGGTNPSGGSGSVWSVMFALLSLMFLSSGFQIMRFSNFTVDLIWGAFLMLVMVINYYRTKQYAQD